MPRRYRKRLANAVDCEVSEAPLPGGVEYFSIDIFQGKATKKRTFEDIAFDIEPIEDISPFPSFEEIPLSSLEDTPLSSGFEDGAPATGGPKGPSRSVSVSSFLELRGTTSDR